MQRYIFSSRAARVRTNSLFSTENIAEEHPPLGTLRKSKVKG